MNVYALGASKNIGYYATLRLLAKGATVTFLLRSPNVFKDDASMQPFITSGHARIVQGDALKAEDVAKGWQAALSDPQMPRVDLVLFTIGAAPAGFSITRGGLISPADICSHALLNVLRTLPSSLRSDLSVQPRIIILSSIGIGKESHTNLPFLYKPLYSWLLAQPHEDKFGIERILARCAGQPWTDREPSEEVLPPSWQTEEGTPDEGSLKRVLVIRAALLHDGACKGDAASESNAKKPPYRVGEEKDMKGHNGYFVSRRDVAHFIVEDALPNWDKWEGKSVCIAY
ncbi:hypothetical protein BDW22DRAFT_670 [Trametopsis cervina]|nr:hypothetical protein BDW22DRAFT_670 [Trametopsis cervina]